MSEESRRGEGGSAAGHAGEPGAVPAGPPAHVMDTLERTVQRILQVGIAVSFALMAAGLVIALASGDELAARVVPPDGLAAGIASLDSAAFVSLGLIVLIATPFVRVAGSLLAFARLRDRRYALVTAAVLAVMCVSVLIGTT